MMTVFFVLLLIFAAFVAAIVTALSADFHSSDAAGNGMAQGFAFFGAIVFWVVVGVLLVLCGVRNGFGTTRVLVAVAALAVAITSQFMAMSLLQDMRSGDAYETALRAMVGALPLVTLLYTLWAFFPGMHAALSPRAANITAGVAALIVCAIPWVAMVPVQATEQARSDAYERERAADEAKVKEIQALPADTPLLTFLQYTDVPPEQDTEARRAALDRIKEMPNKQAAVEDILAQGDTRMLRQLRSVEVKVTPRLCEGGKKTGRLVADDLKPRSGMATFEQMEPKLNVHMDGLEWLNENGCDCKAEFGVIEQTVRMYPESYPRKWSLDHLLELQGKPREP